MRSIAPCLLALSLMLAPVASSAVEPKDVPAAGQTPAPAQAPAMPEEGPPAQVGGDQDEDGLHPDFPASEGDGFVEIVMAERKDDPRTPIIRKEFIKSIEASVGQDGSHPFTWALVDVNGDGYNDLIIQSLAPGLREREGFEGVRVIVYTFNGKTWSLALDAGAMVIGYKTDEDAVGPERHKMAMVQEMGYGYVLFEWDGNTFVRPPFVDTSRWKQRTYPAPAPDAPSPPPTLEGNTSAPSPAKE